MTLEEILEETLDEILDRHRRFREREPERASLYPRQSRSRAEQVEAETPLR